MFWFSQIGHRRMLKVSCSRHTWQSCESQQSHFLTLKTVKFLPHLSAAHKTGSVYLCPVGLLIGDTIWGLHCNSKVTPNISGLRVWSSATLPNFLLSRWLSITKAICEWKLAWCQSGLNKCSLISMVQRQDQLRTSVHTQRQRLERRLCLGFLLLEQRFMVGESCRESLRLNYTDREHQIQEKLPRLWRGW